MPNEMLNEEKTSDKIFILGWMIYVHEKQVTKQKSSDIRVSLKDGFKDDASIVRWN